MCRESVLDPMAWSSEGRTLYGRSKKLAEIKLDNAYKFGAGRYIQEPGALKRTAAEAARLGTKARIIAGEHAWAATKGNVEASLNEAGFPFVLSIYSGQNTYTRAKEHALRALTSGCDVIIGIGGGRIMDQAKATAHFAGSLPTLLIPTSIATCAAFAPVASCIQRMAHPLAAFATIMR